MSISQLHSDIVVFIFPINQHNWEYVSFDKSDTKEEEDRILQTQLFGMQKLPYPNGDSDEEIKAYNEKYNDEISTLINACENVIAKYDVFRSLIKKHHVI